MNYSTVPNSFSPDPDRGLLDLLRNNGVTRYVMLDLILTGSSAEFIYIGASAYVLAVFTY